MASGLPRGRAGRAGAQAPLGPGNPRTPPEVQLLIEGLALLGPGALWGAIFGYAAHAATRGQRDFSSVLTLAAARYDLIARDGTAERARTCSARPRAARPGLCFPPNSQPGARPVPSSISVYQPEDRVGVLKALSVTGHQAGARPGPDDGCVFARDSSTRGSGSPSPVRASGQARRRCCPQRPCSGGRMS